MIIEHREHMRIDDRLLIAWRPSKSENLLTHNVGDITLLSMNREIQYGIAALHDQEPSVAKLLEQINHKLDLIADDTSSSIYGPSLRRVNLSYSGLAFEWNSAISQKSDIRLTLTLPPENRKLAIIAHVLSCEPTNTGGRYLIRCRFEQGDRTAQATLMQYIDYTVTMRNESNRLSAPVHMGLAPASAPEEQPLNEPAALLKYR